MTPPVNLVLCFWKMSKSDENLSPYSSQILARYFCNLDQQQITLSFDVLFFVGVQAPYHNLTQTYWISDLSIDRNFEPTLWHLNSTYQPYEFNHSFRFASFKANECTLILFSIVCNYNTDFSLSLVKLNVYGVIYSLKYSLDNVFYLENFSIWGA